MTPLLEDRPHTPPRIDILAVCGTAWDRYLLQAIVAETNWSLRCVNSVAAAKRLLLERPVPVVLSASELEDGTWQDVVRLVRALPEDGRIIVFTVEADEHLWQQILDAGADDVLTKPFDASDCLEVVCLAYHSWWRHHAALACR